MGLEDGIRVGGSLAAARALLGPPAKEGPRRNLFGTRPDGARLRQELSALLCDSLNAARSRWAFDVATESPVPGGDSWEWEALRAQDVPAFYRERAASETPRGARQRRPRAEAVEKAGLLLLHPPGAEEQSPPPPPPPPPQGGGCCPGSARRRRRQQQQAQITDFFSSKKVKTSPAKRVTQPTQRTTATAKRPAL